MEWDEKGQSGSNIQVGFKERYWRQRYELEGCSCSNSSVEMEAMDRRK